jgi:hypothetical protein
VDRQPGTPFRVAHDRGAELGVIRQPGVVGRSAEQGHEQQPLLGGDCEIVMVSEHLLIASVAFGVDGWAAHHLHPPIGHMCAMLLADAPAEHRGDLGSLELDEVIEPRRPIGHSRRRTDWS